MASIYRQSAIVLGGFTLVGWVAMKGMEGPRTELIEKYGSYDQSGGKKKYDQTQMMANMLKGGGASDLSALREATAQKRLKIAEENTKYNIATERNKEEN